jgi:hypothetical protein
VVLARVGSGATGVVWKAREIGSGRIVALKVLHPELARDRRFVSRLSREARVSASLDHPNVARGLDLREGGGAPCLVLEFVEGKSLKTVLRERGRLPEEEVLSIGRQIAEALSHAHGRGVVHRDVKPGNVILEPGGRARLTDFGLARAPLDASITREGATLGTPQYLPPEQARDVASASPRSDLYGLGATLFHAATGAPPFDGERIADVLTKVLFEPAPDPAARNPGLSPGLCLVLRKLLLKNPARRQQSAEELLRDLTAVERRQTPAIEPHTVVEVPARAAPRRTLLLVAIGALALAGGVALLLRGTGARGSGESARLPSGTQPAGTPDRSVERLAEGDFERALRAGEEAARAAAERRRFAEESALFDQEIPDRAREALGRSVDSLSEPFAARWRTSMERARAVFREKGRDAARWFRDDLDRHLRERLRPEVLRLAEGNSFRTALQRLGTGLDSFRDAKGLRLEDLHPEEGEAARRTVEAFRGDLEREIRVRAAGKAAEAEQVMRSLRERFEKELASGQTLGAAAAFDRAAREALLDRGIDLDEFGPALPEDPRARAEEHRLALARLEARVEASSAERLFQALDEELSSRLRNRQFAAVAREWKERLGRPALSAVAERIRARIEEAETLARLRDRFADAVDGAVDEAFELRAKGIAHFGKISRRYDRERDAVELLPQGRGPILLSFRDLHPDSIERKLGFLDPATGQERPGLPAEDRFARALFRLRCGDPAEGERLLRSLSGDPRAGALLVRVEEERRAAQEGQASRPARALEAVRTARDLRRQEELDRAKAAYDRALGEFGDTAEVKAEADALRRERSEVEAAIERRERGDRLLRIAPGAEVKWEGDRPSLAFAFGPEAPSSWKVPKGWKGGPTGLRKDSSGTLGSLREEAGPRLEVPLDAARGWRADFSVRFPFEAGDPRLVGFAAGGHAFLVRARGEERGSEVAHLEGPLAAVEESLRARPPRTPRRTSLAFAAGASYEVALEVEPGGKRARLLVDRVEWGAGAGEERGKEACDVEMRCAGGIELRSVRVTGVLEAPRPR